ncbi:hypothetical protein CBL_00198 [Carabus blaptoides fortunei]
MSYIFYTASQVVIVFPVEEKQKRKPAILGPPCTDIRKEYTTERGRDDGLGCNLVCNDWPGTTATSAVDPLPSCVYDLSYAGINTSLVLISPIAAHTYTHGDVLFYHQL